MRPRRSVPHRRRGSAAGRLFPRAHPLLQRVFLPVSAAVGGVFRSDVEVKALRLRRHDHKPIHRRQGDQFVHRHAEELVRRSADCIAIDYPPGTPIFADWEARRDPRSRLRAIPRSPLQRLLPRVSRVSRTRAAGMSVNREEWFWFVCHAHGFAWACVVTSPAICGLDDSENVTVRRMPTQSRGHGTQIQLFLTPTGEASLACIAAIADISEKPIPRLPDSAGISLPAQVEIVEQAPAHFRSPTSACSLSRAMAIIFSGNGRAFEPLRTPLGEHQPATRRPEHGSQIVLRCRAWCRRRAASSARRLRTACALPAASASRCESASRP